MRSIPAAAAIAAALLFGAQAQAQTGMTTPPGSTKPQDQANPAPGNKAMPARAGADGNNSSGSPVGKSDTMIGGTTKNKDNVMPAPVAGNGTSAKMAEPGMNGPGAATTVPGTTKNKDAVNPAPMGGKGGMTAEERATAKSEKAAARAKKRADKKMGMAKPAGTTPEAKAHAN